MYRVSRLKFVRMFFQIYTHVLEKSKQSFFGVGNKRSRETDTLINSGDSLALFPQLLSLSSFLLRAFPL